MQQIYFLVEAASAGLKLVQSLSLVCNMSWREFVVVDDEPVLE